MPTLYIDMPSGIAGDMLLAALIACGADRVRIEQDLLALGCGPIGLAVEPVMAGPMAALRVTVDAEQEPRWIQGPSTLKAHDPAPDHQHRPYAAIRDRLARTTLPERVVGRAQRCFRLLAEAEGAVHGIAPELVEFHVVGSIVAIADVVGCCLALEQLDIDRVVAGPLMPGHGTVSCAHGRMPVPVPAVAEMLRRCAAPTRLIGWETGELTTPTGCALVCGLADSFLGATAPQSGTIIATGTGAGRKVIPGLVNAVRCLVMTEAAGAGNQLWQLEATIDDMSGEDLALAAARLLDAGARDVWIVPVLMKKGRPGSILCLLAADSDRQRLADDMLTHTSTIGVRWHAVDRQVLSRSTGAVMVRGQRIRTKTVTLPDGSTRCKPEAEDVAAAATALGLPVGEIRRLAASG